MVLVLGLILAVVRIVRRPPDETQRLIRALSEKETALEGLHAKCWSYLPGSARRALDFLRPTHENRRRLAALDLGRLSPPPAEAVSALVRAIQDPDSVVRRRALQSLAQYGAIALPAVPDLLVLMNTVTNDLGTRVQAGRTLMKVAGDGERVRTTVLDFFRSPSLDSAARRNFLRTFGELGPGNADIDAAVAQAFPAADTDLALGILRYFQETVGTSEEVIRALAEPLATIAAAPDREALARSGLAWGTDGRVIHGVPRTIVGLCGPYRSQLASSVLLSVVDRAVEAQPMLREDGAAFSPQATALHSTAAALISQRLSVEELKPRLAALTRSPSKQVRSVAAFALWDLMPEHPDARRPD